MNCFYSFVILFPLSKVLSKEIKFDITLYKSKGILLWDERHNSPILSLDGGWISDAHDTRRNIHIESFCACANPLCLYEDNKFKIHLNRRRIFISCNNLDNFTIISNRDGLASSNIEVVGSQGLHSNDFSGYVSNVKKDVQVIKRVVISERCNNETCEIGECVNIFPNETICLCDKVVGNGEKCDKTFNTEKYDIICQSVRLGAAKFSSMNEWNKMSLLYEEDPNEKIDIYVERSILIIETSQPGGTCKHHITKKFNNSGSHVVILGFDVEFKKLRIYYYHNGELVNKSNITVELPKRFKLIPQIGKSIGVAAKISASLSVFDEICKENKNVTTPPRKSITEVYSVKTTNIPVYSFCVCKPTLYNVVSLIFSVIILSAIICRFSWMFRHKIRNYVPCLRSNSNDRLKSVKIHNNIQSHDEQTYKPLTGQNDTLISNSNDRNNIQSHNDETYRPLMKKRNSFIRHSSLFPKSTGRVRSSLSEGEIPEHDEIGYHAQVASKISDCRESINRL